MNNQDGLGFDEQRAAEELDALLTAKLSGQDVIPSGDVSPQEATFAVDLVELADATPLDPAFKADLGTQLERAARPTHPQTRWPFLQILNPARRSTMFKRTAIALASAAVLAILIFLALPLLSPQSDLPPLPSLAMLSAYAQGGTSGSGVFPGTTFVLSTTLPSAPAKLTVYRQPELVPLTVADVQRWAERFGLHGQVYRQRVQPNSDAIWRATVFDGSRVLTVTSGDWVSYSDNALQDALNSAPALPFQAMADSARNFLQPRGLIDFPYRVEPVPDVKNMVRFARLMNDRAVQNSYVQVGVTPNGQVATVEYHPLAFDPAGEYPLRSAQTAWAELTAGQLSSQMQYTIRRDAPGSASATPTKFWRPQYRPGQRADLYGSITVYEPSDRNGALLIRLNEFDLRGNVQGLSDQAGVQLHIWGTNRQGNVLDVTGWEKDPAPLFSPFQGTIKRASNLVLLQRADGKTFALPNAPDDLPDGIAVSGGGRETNRTEGNYPVLDWTSVMSPPNSLPSFSQSDGGTSFQGNAVVVPVKTVAPIPGRPTGLPTPPFAANQRVEGLQGWLLAFISESADGKTRTLNATLAQMSLSKEPGWQAKLSGPGIEGIGQYDRLRVRVWGRFSIQNEEPTITVERYEKAVPAEHIQAWLGKEEIATVAGQEVAVFQSNEGQRFVLALSLRNPSSLDYMRQPTDLPGGGQQMLMQGVVRRENFAGYPIVEEISAHSDANIRAMTDLKGYQLELRPQVIRSQRPPMPGKAYVEHVELIYYAIANPMMGFSYKPMPDMSMRIVQPLWKFTGHTQDGASFEILVQAVSDQYVK